MAVLEPNPNFKDEKIIIHDEEKKDFLQSCQDKQL